MKKFPKETRTCIACRIKKNKKEFLRIVKMPDGRVEIDEKGNLEGRGIYICQEKKCFQMVIQKHLLDKNLRRTVEKSIYDYIRKRVE